MAITASVPTGASFYDSTGGTSDATDSWTPSGNECTYVCFTHGVAGGGSDEATVSGNGLTWTRRGNVEFDSVASPARRIAVHTASGVATAGATTVDFGSESQAGIIGVVVEVEGTDISSNDGVVLTNVLTNRADSGTAESVALNAFASATNACLAFFVQDTNAVPTEEVTFTELSSGTFAGPNTGAVVAFFAEEDTSPTATGSNNAWAAIAIELIEDDGGGEVAAVPTRAVMGVGT